MGILYHKQEDLSQLKYNTLIDIECDNCKKVFNRQRKRVSHHFKQGRSGLFCSINCRHKSAIKKEVKNCSFCRLPIIRRPSDIKSNKVFCSYKCQGAFYKKPKPPKKERPFPRSKIECICECLQCQKTLYKIRANLLKCKHNRVFCSKACRMRYQNLQHKPIIGYRKSKAEIFISALIKSDFPNLTISENSRQILPSKLEIDIYIPEKKLAIELNGPVHYFPIYGEDRLKSCKERDSVKQMELQLLKIDSIVMDISHLRSKKKTHQFLTSYYNDFIKPRLQ